MAENTQVRNDVWQDPEFEGLSPDAKLLWLNLLTTPARNTAGLFHYSIGRMAFETGLSRDKAAQALAALIDLEWVEYDEPTGVVWVCNFVRRQPCGPTMIPKIKRDIEEGFGSDHLLVARFRIRYAALYNEPSDAVYPTDTVSVPYDYPTNTGPIPSARKQSKEESKQGSSKAQQSTEESLLAVAVRELPKTESSADDLRKVICRHLDRKLLPRQIEATVYELADWWPANACKGKKARTMIHLTLQQWLMKLPPESASSEVGPQYENIVVPDGAW